MLSSTITKRTETKHRIRHENNPEERALLLEGKKRCIRCHHVQPLDQFTHNPGSFGDRHSQCRTCCREYQTDRRAAHPEEGMIRRARKRAKAAGIPFDLQVEDILPLPQICPVLGVPFIVGRRSPCNPSLDRIDNTRGYICGNVAVISDRANRIKRDGTAEEHQQIADWMRRQGVK
jgi:hypothetical protein